MNKRIIVISFISLVILLAAVVLDGGFRFLNRGKYTGEVDIANSRLEENNKNLSSFFTNKSEYDVAFSRVSVIEKKNILAGIISHHFLAKDLIARFFSGIDSSGIENIILVGPDHYSALDRIKADAVTTKLSWNTPYGQLDSNKEILDKILAEKNIIENNSVFKTEHSIYILIPFVKKVFPEARIIPLVVHNTNEYEKFISIGDSLRGIAGNRSLLIVSSDFSHNALIDEAQKNDSISVENLENLNEKNISAVTSDCRACVAVLYGFLKNDLNEFYLAENKNSADFGSRDKTVTSYVSGYYLWDMQK